MSKNVRRVVTAGSAVAVVLTTAGTASAGMTASAQRVERVSVTSGEKQADGSAPRFLKMSAHGRHVVFDSPASNLVAGDTNDAKDVFVRDRARGLTTRVSVSSSERQANESSSEGAISADGRFVVFTSGASNLVAGDTNKGPDVFVRDLAAGTTVRVSLTSNGRQANGFSYLPTISADGRYVAFQSSASNLVPGDTNGFEDVFVRDLRLATTTRVSVPTGGGQFRNPSAEPVISANGRRVGFISNPRNPDIFDVYLRDLDAKTTHRVSSGLRGKPLNGGTGQIAISGNGRYVAYPSDASNIVRGDTNNAWDLFVFDSLTGVTRRAAAGVGGAQSNGDTDQGSLSYSGRYVGFASSATNLVARDTNGVRDAFVRDMRTGTTTRISTGRWGQQANSDSGPDFAPEVAVSADGRHAAFVSDASNLVRGDTNDAPDVFAWDAPRR